MSESAVTIELTKRQLRVTIEAVAYVLAVRGARRDLLHDLQEVDVVLRKARGDDEEGLV